MEIEMKMNKEANAEVKTLIFLDKEDLMRLRGTIDGDIGACFAKISKTGDLAFIGKNGTSFVGHAVVVGENGQVIDERNAKIKNIIEAGENAKVMVKRKGRYVPIDIQAKDGVLDLRELNFKSKK